MNPAGWAGLMVSRWIPRHRNGGMIRLAVPGFIIVDAVVIIRRAPLGKRRAVLNREGKASGRTSWPRATPRPMLAGLRSASARLWRSASPPRVWRGDGEV